MPSPVHDAVTALLLHGRQLCLVQRHPALSAFPGYHAFPGGKVDPEDADEPVPHTAFAGVDARKARALRRELREELDLDLFAIAGRGGLGEIRCIGQVTTPSWVPVRFRTWFFVVTLDEPPVLRPDGSECVAAEMRPVADWLESYETGRLLLAPPTLLALRSLIADPRLSALPGFPADLDAEREVPWVEPLAGLRILLVRSNTLPPAQHTNAFWIGDEGAPKVLVDPSPANSTEFGRLCRRIDAWGLDRVLLTHHHPDHREYADEIARRYRVPLLLSADCRDRLAAKCGESFFSGIEVQTVGDSFELTRWQDEPVHLLPVPGHDEGQLAPMPASRAWCIVGDLIQGIGTVVIAPPEGNMRRYFDTLRRVIDLNPAVVIPSHGMALGTTHYLQQALRHREQREQQILSLHANGHSEDGMLAEIYRDVDPRLQPLARVNIRSHLQKLREEGRIADT